MVHKPLVENSKKQHYSVFFLTELDWLIRLPVRCPSAHVHNVYLYSSFSPYLRGSSSNMSVSQPSRVTTEVRVFRYMPRVHKLKYNRSGMNSRAISKRTPGPMARAETWHSDGRTGVPDGRTGLPSGRVSELSADFSPIKSPLKVSLLEKLAKMSQIRILGCPELDFHRFWMRFGYHFVSIFRSFP